MESMKDAMETPLMAICGCGKATVQTGRCVAFDHIAKHWTYLTWPVRPGTIEVHGTPNVAGCPVCFVVARKEWAVGPEQMPKEALDHLEKLHAEKQRAKIAPVHQDAEGEPQIFDLPEVREV